MSQVLDDLLGVLCLSSTRFPTGRVRGRREGGVSGAGGKVSGGGDEEKRGEGRQKVLDRERGGGH